MKSSFKSLALVAILFAAAPAFAQDTAKTEASKSTATKSAKGPSKEDRETMAKAHEKMAACLRSDKDMRECGKEMHQECSSMGEKSCGMMGMGMGHGMGHGMMHEDHH